jgi:hypothetical protein
MTVLVTKHAVKRYRERLFDYSSSDERIKQLLAEISAKGKMNCVRPDSQHNCFEVEYRGISVVLLDKEDRLVVITCLGDCKYRKWIKHKEARLKVSQSLRWGLCEDFGYCKAK